MALNNLDKDVISEVLLQLSDVELKNYCLANHVSLSDDFWKLKVSTQFRIGSWRSLYQQLSGELKTFVATVELHTTGEIVQKVYTTQADAFDFLVNYMFEHNNVLSETDFDYAALVANCYGQYEWFTPEFDNFIVDKSYPEICESVKRESKFKDECEKLWKSIANQIKKELEQFRIFNAMESNFYVKECYLNRS